ncbi:DUF3817 domain-containing protein [Pirellulaceae bacterium SH467]
MESKLESHGMPASDTQSFRDQATPRSNRIVTLFRVIGILEGVSYLLLLFVAMPVKYGWKEPILVEIFGAAHGFLFVAYVFLAALAIWLKKWPAWVFLQAFLASLVPFGTFWMDRRIATRMSLDSKSTS